MPKCYRCMAPYHKFGCHLISDHVRNMELILGIDLERYYYRECKYCNTHFKNVRLWLQHEKLCGAKRDYETHLNTVIKHLAIDIYRKRQHMLSMANLAVNPDGQICYLRPEQDTSTTQDVESIQTLEEDAVLTNAIKQCKFFILSELCIVFLFFIMMHSMIFLLMLFFDSIGCIGLYKRNSKCLCVYILYQILVVLICCIISIYIIAISKNYLPFIFSMGYSMIVVLFNHKLQMIIQRLIQ